MKTGYTNIKKVVFSALLFFYISICFIQHNSGTDLKFESYLEAKQHALLSTNSVLLEKNDSKLNDNDYLLSTINKQVFADTLIYRISYENDRHYLKALIPNNFSKRVLLKLELDKNFQFDEKIEFSSAVISADITKVNLLPVFKSLETFEHETLWSSLEYDVLLEGKLSEILYSSKI